MSERRAYRLSGRVQGVGFRWWARERAAELRIGGTVRNTGDGAVEIEAAGDPLDLDRFEASLRQGPPAARVDRLERRPPGDAPLPPDLQIRR